MVSSLSTVLLAASAFASFVLGQAANGASSGASSGGQCGAQGGGAKCGSDSPCCSTYGQCGVGAYCLGGCNPKYSFNLQSCMPAPVCQSQDYKMDSLDDIMPNTKYLGDSSDANWVSSGTPVAYQNQAVLLTMAPSTVGTLLSSTHYVWYGKVSATLSTSQGAGVVTAFILMSDVQDEIDFEFVGVDLETAQTNFYYQGITNYENSENISVTDTRQNTHTYEIDWQPDQLTWSIDGQVKRTLKRSDTYNETSKSYHYPQTPSRIMLSLWPAGLSSNAKGTIDWAGGLVNWDSPYMQNGYYYAMFSDVNVQCYDPPSGYQNNGNKAYEYTNTAGTQDDVETTNDNTILGSFLASGNDQKKGASNASGTSSAGSAATSEVNSVPGVSGGGGNTGFDSSPATNPEVAGSGGNSATVNGNQVGGQSGFSQGGDTQKSTGDAGRLLAGGLVSIAAGLAAVLML